jgi:SAM-dependent methyltransferase
MNSLSKLRNNFNSARKTAADFSSAKKQLLSSPSVSEEEKALLKKITLRIHPNDGMYQGNARHYLSVGLSAIRCVETALKKSKGNQPIRSVLDFPCGYGRVLRFLRARFPHAEICASEIDPDMLNFCRRAFSVDPIISDSDFNKISLPNKFDLIWCGSLFTHINETAAINLLTFFYEHLAPNGLCVFTTHGQFSVDSLKNQTITYGLQENEQNEVISQFHKNGYGYSDYWNQHGYGISAVSHEHMTSLFSSIGGWKEIFFMERGWDNHQDVYGLTAY